MWFFIGFVIFAAVIFVLFKFSQSYSGPVRFFLQGLDSGFKFSEIMALWNAVKLCSIDEPLSIFISTEVLTKCITKIKSDADTDGTVNSSSMQKLLSKLYDFRTKIEKEADKKRGLDSTRSLDEGQRLRIILPGKGVFSSEILNNGHNLIIKIPTQKEMIEVEGKDWIGKTISVYLWRKGDARYVFDTNVNGAGVFLGKAALFLDHSSTLTRTQKRSSIRAKCNLNGMLYFIKDKKTDYTAVENKDGYRCKIEDISEKGALIRTAGKGIANLTIKIQFQLQDRLVVMSGIVRTVEYNENIHQSRLHFECVHIDPVMKNIVLSFVYNILPEKEKEIYDANSLIDKDEELSPAEKRNLESQNGENQESDEKEEQLSAFDSMDLGEQDEFSVPDYEKLRAQALENTENISYGIKPDGDEKNNLPELSAAEEEFSPEIY